MVDVFAEKTENTLFYGVFPAYLRLFRSGPDVDHLALIAHKGGDFVLKPSL